jgi:dihydrofolate reductase
MGKVIVEVSPSVDGYVAGRGVSLDKPFGDADMRLHRWMGQDGTQPTAADRAAFDRMYAATRAVVLGRRMFDVGIGPWGEDGAFGMPAFVVTRRGGKDLVKGPTTFTFVTEGAARAVELARTVAGNDDVAVVGERTSFSNVSRRDWSTKSASTWCQSCSARGRGCSNDHSQTASSSSKSVWSRRRMPRI